MLLFGVQNWYSLNREPTIWDFSERYYKDITRVNKIIFLICFRLLFDDVPISSNAYGHVVFVGGEQTFYAKVSTNTKTVILKQLLFKFCF